MKWKLATAGAVAAALLSAPVANAAPANSNGNAGPNTVGQAISAIAAVAGGGGSPGAVLDALNQVKGVLKGLKPGKRHSQGKGVDARAAAEATKANVGKTLRKPPSPVGGKSDPKTAPTE